MIQNILNAFCLPIDKKRLHAFREFLATSSVVGGVGGLIVGWRLGSPVLGAIAGGVGATWLVHETGHAHAYAHEQARVFERKERRRLISQLACMLPHVRQDLETLPTRNLYALAHFKRYKVETLSEQALLSVLLTEIEQNQPNLFQALQKP